MNLKVIYTGQLRTVVGRAEETVDVADGGTLAELLEWLAQRCPPAARLHLVTDAGQPRPSLLIDVNGRAVPAAAAGKCPVREGDIVTLWPPIAGG